MSTTAHGSQASEEPSLRPATLAAGCFWCIEAIYRQLPGVSAAISGYMGGMTDNPDYQSVCSGNTGHAEVVQITFDPDEVSYEKLLAVFFAVHDPTQLNRQGNDIGTQYRSAIFYHDQHQLDIAEQMIARLNEDHAARGLPPIVTTLEPAATFFKAEAYHQDYWTKNPSNPYCNLLIPEKLTKMEKILSSLN